MKKRIEWLLWDQWRQFRRLPNDRKALRLGNFRPFGSSGRFPTRLGGPSWRTQLRQQFTHPSTHLLWRRLALLVFPRMQFNLDQIACQNHKIMRNGDDMRPALKLFRCTHTRPFPQQRLLVEAISMFLTKAQNIPQGNLLDVSRLVSDPDKPTDA